MENVNCLRCRFRHEDNGNCTAVGGFCTAVSAAHCRLLQEYLGTGLTPEGVEALTLSKVLREVSDAPAADVAPVVHSRWAHIGGDEWCCPVCGFVITTEGSWDKPTKKYCEDCGAKMDEGADNDTN